MLTDFWTVLWPCGLGPWVQHASWPQLSLLLVVTLLSLLLALHNQRRYRRLCADHQRRMAEFEGTVAALDRAIALAEFDAQGHVLHANGNYLDMMGYTLAEIQGRHHAIFCTPQAVVAPTYAVFWRRLAQGDLVAGEVERVAKGGRTVWLYATYNPIRDADGRVCRIVKFALDLTERRVMEQELRHTKERAEQAAAARSSFLANIGHEIRTPMNAILGLSEALLDTPLDADQRRQLGLVHQAGKSLLRLLNDILDTARLEKGTLVLERADFSLRQLCRHVLDGLQGSASSKGLALRLDYPAQLPEHFCGDAQRVQQVVFNLLSNAVKFTATGEVCLRVRQVQEQLLLQVQDSGIGIAPEQLSHIFEPFTQADASITRRFGGMGLGITIARQLVELMGGRIEAQSTLGQGTVFSVYLTLPPGRMAAAAALTDAAQATTDADASGTLTALAAPMAAVAPQCCAWVQTACQALAHGEVPDEALAQLQALLPASEFEVVQQAIHRFDFDGAQQLLQRWVR